MFRIIVALIALSFGATSGHAADAALQAFLDKTVASAREGGQLPALAVLVQVDGEVKAISANGTRRAGHKEPVGVDDLWHIGSDTKAITATMVARLVERGVLGFDTSVAACFPSFAGQIDAAYKDATLTQLMSHSARLPALTDDGELGEYMETIWDLDEGDVVAQRLALAQHYLAKPPAFAAGTFNYSNLGFIIAGACAEQKTGKRWEDLVTEEVFTPLGVKSFGFGAPGVAGIADQPRGHRDVGGGKLEAIEPNQDGADNPPSLGPAGTVHIALKDWVLFAQDHLDGELGHGKLLKPETYRTLHTVILADSHYALGWGVLRDEIGAAELLTHSGSNGNWFADVRIMPKRNTIYLVVTNAGNEAANNLPRLLGEALDGQLKK